MTGNCNQIFSANLKLCSHIVWRWPWLPKQFLRIPHRCKKWQICRSSMFLTVLTQVILATAGYDHTIKFWAADSGVCTRTLQHPDSQVKFLVLVLMQILVYWYWFYWFDQWNYSGELSRSGSGWKHAGCWWISAHKVGDSGWRRIFAKVLFDQDHDQRSQDVWPHLWQPHSRGQLWRHQ